MSLGTRYVLVPARCPAQCALPQQLLQQHLLLGTSSPSLPARQKLLAIQAFIQKQSSCETRIEFSQEKLSSPSLPLPAQTPLSSPRCPQLHYCLPQDNPGGQGDSNMCVLPHETFYLLTVLLSFPAEKPRYCPRPILAHSLVSRKTLPSPTNRFSFLIQMPHFPP